jgi:serine/threonine-protein kinase HipA
LGFGLGPGPPAPKREFNKTLDLERLLGLADAIIADEDPPQGLETNQVEDLMLIGTSMGGARPKTVVEDDDGLWIAKFNRPDDRWNHARAEHAMLVLARACGIQSAESRIIEVGGRDVLLVKRFDRKKADGGYLRARMVSGLTLLRAEDTHQHRERWSYVLMAEELRRVSANPKQDAAELFRRMAFNALISNIDDHPRNHAIIAKAREWKLSPAYDLMPSTPVSLERRDLALSCGDWGRYAHAENLLSQSRRFYLRREQAEAVITAMEKQISATWYETARRAGVSEKDCATISSAFVYPGFRLPVEEQT